jgi:thiamine biosynthesis protein ThiS
VRILVNNKESELPGNSTVSELLESFSVPPEKTLVSVNGKTLTSDDFDSTRLKDGDSVDLFTFVAGG